jgi:hypothetical protein
MLVPKVYVYKNGQEKHFNVGENVAKKYSDAELFLHFLLQLHREGSFCGYIHTGCRGLRTETQTYGLE